MKSACIYVFSGTGNTRLAADMVASELQKRGVATDIVDIRLPYPEPDPGSYDTIGIAYPIHAFNAPRIVRDFVRTFPEDKGKRVFFFKTSGEPFPPNNSSSFSEVRILKKKGYVCLEDMHMLMPYNIMFRYPDSLVKQMYLHTQGMARLLAKRVVEGSLAPASFKPYHTAFAMALRLQWLGADINSHLLSVSRDKCTKCLKCVKGCPAGNIEFDGVKIRFKSACTMCMRCVMLCPQSAVRAGFLQPWKVNGAYDFKALAEDESVPAEYVKKDTKGYFKLFRKYYEKTGDAMDAGGEKAGDV